MSAPVTPHLPHLRSVGDGDWPAIRLLDSTCFGTFELAEELPALRAMMPPGSAVVACDGDDIVGAAMYLDLRMTVPGGAVLPVAGVTLVAVAPTHRRRGLLRAMFTDLHARIADGGYPVAALTASEGGIYGRFGYGPATVQQRLEVDRRFARFHADAPDPGGVRMVTAAGHHDDFTAIYERWRRRTPGGLLRPRALLEQHLADRESGRDGGSALHAMLHPDGFVVYRVHRDVRTVRIEELTAATADAHTALWRAVLGLDLIEKVAVTTHPGDPLPYLLTDARVVRTTASRDDLWLRILDVPAALQARSYACDLSTVVELTDGFRSDGGRFALAISDGRARCTPTDAQAEVRMGLDVLGSLYLGGHRASVMAAAGRIRGAGTELLSRLDAAFATEVPAELGFGF